eukprot:461434-Pelagomonas_calceolata.AAC.11
MHICVRTYDYPGLTAQMKAFNCCCQQCWPTGCPPWIKRLSPLLLRGAHPGLTAQNKPASIDA